VLGNFQASIDPEALAEVQKNQAQMHGQVNAMQNLDFTDGISKFLAGNSGGGSGPSAAAAGGAGASGSGSGRSGGRQGGGGPQRRK
jgi:hypothetical protein